jgi:hypothetical protein
MTIQEFNEMIYYDRRLELLSDYSISELLDIIMENNSKLYQEFSEEFNKLDEEFEQRKKKIIHEMKEEIVSNHFTF